MKGIFQTIYWSLQNNSSIIRLLSSAGLALYLIMPVVLCYLNRILYFLKYKKKVNFFRKTLRKFIKNKKMHVCICGTGVGGILLSFLIDLPGLQTVQEQGRIYMHTELAEQKDIDCLFSQRISENNEWKESESLSKLHVEKGFVNADISQGMFDYYDDLFSKIYNGTNMESGGGRDLKENQNAERETYFSIDNVYISEAYRWKKLYDSSDNPAYLYHYGRALNDAAMTISQKPFSVVLEIAADAISSEENFLSYDDRNINGDEPIIINAENISLMNGKLYLNISIRAEAGGEERGYINCFLVEAYTCIRQGRLKIDINDEAYALMTYYLGNVGETMLGKIPENDNLYKIVGNEALENYENALELIENNPGFYLKEENMEKNMRDGIATLNQLGFFSEREADLHEISP